MDENLKNRTLEILNKDQDQLKGVYDNQSEYTAPETTEKITVTENSDGTWTENKETVDTNLKDGGVVGEREKEIEDEARILQEFCAVIDNEFIGILSQIDDKKREIITLSAQAGTHINCTSTQVGGGFTCINMKEETETVHIYTKMAGPNVDYTTVNPFEPDTTISLSGVTTHYAGFGYENDAESVVFKNSSGSATGLKTDGSGPGISTLGRFDLSGAGTPLSGALTCTQIKTQIDALYDEIIVLRNRMNQKRSDLNTVKDKKSDKELQNWGCKNTKQEVNDRASSESATISAVIGLSTAI